MKITKNVKKILTTGLAVVCVFGMTACGGGSTESDYKYVAKENDKSKITVYKDSTTKSGTGYVTKGYECGNDVWTITGKFKYDSKGVTMTSGTFNGQKFTDVSVSAGAKTIKFNGKKYNLQ